ncbi:MAG TPA: zinc ribbon domain-containing protein, partial [Candidatus Nanopelagicales bacterium]|nr:zinc ribbon domain-containing protein [Candidatus Nanopelagicales bacterium]
PDLSREVLPAPFPDLQLAGPAVADDLPRDGAVGAAAAWPTADLSRTTTGAGTAPTADGTPSLDALPTAELPESGEEPHVLARPEAFDAAPASAGADELTAAELAEIETALAAVHPAARSAAVMPAPEHRAEPEPAPEPEPEPAVEAAAAAVEQVPEPAVATTVDHAAATARGQTRSLLGRFRPGRRSDAAAAAAAAAAKPMPEPEPQPAPVEVAAAAAATAEPAPVPEPEPQSAPVDTVEQPTWRTVAPEVTPAPRPDWPDAPAWPSPEPQANPPGSQVPGSAASPWASRLATARPEPVSVWAASSQEVLAARSAAAANGPGPAVQACVSCGLSLSANARFCRRCGTRQG